MGPSHHLGRAEAASDPPVACGLGRGRQNQTAVQGLPATSPCLRLL